MLSVFHKCKGGHPPQVMRRTVRPLQCYRHLKGYTVLENGYFPVSVFLVAGLFTVGNRYYLVNELAQQGVHVRAVNQFAGVEVNPVGLVVVQVGVCGYFHSRDERAERRAAAGREQYDLASGGSQRSGGHKVVARCRQQVQALGLQPVAIAEHAANQGASAFLRAAEGFVFKRGDAARLVAG